MYHYLFWNPWFIAYFNFQINSLFRLALLDENAMSFWNSRLPVDLHRHHVMSQIVTCFLSFATSSTGLFRTSQILLKGAILLLKRPYFCFDSLFILDFYSIAKALIKQKSKTWRPPPSVVVIKRNQLCNYRCSHLAPASFMYFGISFLSNLI